MATELGFDGPTANSLDATSDRDFTLEFVDALSFSLSTSAAGLKK